MFSLNGFQRLGKAAFKTLNCRKAGIMCLEPFLDDAVGRLLECFFSDTGFII